MKAFLAFAFLAVSSFSAQAALNDGKEKKTDLCNVARDYRGLAYPKMTLKEVFSKGAEIDFKALSQSLGYSVVIPKDGRCSESFGESSVTNCSVCRAAGNKIKSTPLQIVNPQTVLGFSEEVLHRGKYLGGEQVRVKMLLSNDLELLCAPVSRDYDPKSLRDNSFFEVIPMGAVSASCDLFEIKKVDLVPAKKKSGKGKAAQ